MCCILKVHMLISETNIITYKMQWGCSLGWCWYCCCCCCCCYWWWGCSLVLFIVAIVSDTKVDVKIGSGNSTSELILRRLDLWSHVTRSFPPLSRPRVTDESPVWAFAAGTGLVVEGEVDDDDQEGLRVICTMRDVWFFFLHHRDTTTTTTFCLWWSMHYTVSAA